MIARVAVLCAFAAVCCTAEISKINWGRQQQESDSHIYQINTEQLQAFVNNRTETSEPPSSQRVNSTTQDGDSEPPQDGGSEPPPPPPAPREGGSDASTETQDGDSEPLQKGGSEPPPPPQEGESGPSTETHDADSRIPQNGGAELPKPSQGALEKQTKEVENPAYNMDSKSVEKFRQNLRAFSAVMYNRITQNSSPDKNIIFSPVSISYALGMVNTGARGNTSVQIKESLQMNANMLNKDIDTLFKLVIGELLSSKSYSDVKISMAARSYFKIDFPIREQYTKNLQEFYHSDAQGVDFGNSKQATGIINDWVENQTNGLIKDLVKPENFSPLTAFVLVNALYFKAPWARGFTDWDTPMEFLTPSGSVSVPFLQSRAHFKRKSTKKFEYIGIPYKDHKTYYFIIMPKSDEAMKEFEEEKTLKEFFEVLKFRMTSWRTERINLYMPKFTTEMNLDIKKILPSMGVTDVFSSVDADLSGVSRNFLYVTDFLHKARITVNKEGTEAAAATAAIFGLRSLSQKVVINRPFVFGVIGMEGNILFMGRMANPSEK